MCFSNRQSIRDKSIRSHSLQNHHALLPNLYTCHFDLAICTTPPLSNRSNHLSTFPLISVNGKEMLYIHENESFSRVHEPVVVGEGGEAILDYHENIGVRNDMQLISILLQGVLSDCKDESGDNSKTTSRLSQRIKFILTHRHLQDQLPRGSSQ